MIALIEPPTVEDLTATPRRRRRRMRYAPTPIGRARKAMAEAEFWRDAFAQWSYRALIDGGVEIAAFNMNNGDFADCSLDDAISYLLRFWPAWNGGSDMVLWLGQRVVAVIRRAPDGSPIIERFEQTTAG
jgi:hypothetical protein